MEKCELTVANVMEKCLGIENLSIGVDFSNTRSCAKCFRIGFFFSSSLVSVLWCRVEVIH